ncbi:hypothetical protein AYI68_g5227, partial [Smittium mucronatum]
MTFSKTLKRTFTSKPGKKENVIPQEYVMATNVYGDEGDDADIPKIAGGPVSNSVGTGDEQDLIYLRLYGWKHFVKSYVDYFENVSKAQRVMVDCYKAAAES